MERVRVIPVDDHPVVLHGLRAILTADPMIQIVDEATTQGEALRKTAHLQPDIVMLPVRLGGTRSGIELGRALDDVASTRVVFFTSFARPIDIQVATLAGASAVVSKSASARDIVETVHRVARGEAGLVLTAGSHRPRPAPELIDSEGLSEREQEILDLVLDGLTNAAIAERVCVEMSTIKTHMRNILRKLGAGNRRDLLSEAPVTTRPRAPSVR
ncbi:response regulator [Janibacter corallicola]|uniref:response regulator n=1 Tax=Janibacter corallicola TaxID=415212 RepID=UPI00147010BE|nr:response regulator transcription factor [Janibacter corallicola]